MEEKLEELLQKAESNVLDIQQEIDSLRQRCSFLSQHNFNEELRFVRTVLDAKTNIFFQYRTDIENIRELLDKWNQ